ncbi:MAG: hypothetical protein ACM3ZT_07860 [Bacillota bacterium]
MIWKTLFWLAALALLTVGVAFLILRPAVAATCPACFGFSRVADGLYLQSSMTPEARTHVQSVLAESERQIREFYGEQRAHPRLLVCADDACFHRLGGDPGAGTGSLGGFAMMVAPKAVNTVALTEEFAHVELRVRVGLWKIQMGAIPEWFEQGVAVVAADDPLYIRPPSHQSRCLAGSFPDMPATPSEWRDELEQEGDVLYAQSACKTVMWMDSHGGPHAVADLLTQVSRGQAFDSLFKP